MAAAFRDPTTVPDNLAARIADALGQTRPGTTPRVEARTEQAEEARRVAAEAAAARRTEEDRKAAAEKARAKQAAEEAAVATQTEERRRAEAAARVEATAARPEEEDRKAAATVRTREGAAEAAAAVEKAVAQRKARERLQGYAFAVALAAFVAVCVILALKHDTSLHERTIADSPQAALVSTQPEQGNTGQLEAKRIAAVAAEEKAAGARQAAVEKRRNEAVAEAKAAIEKAAAERKTAPPKAAAMGEHDGVVLVGPNEQADEYIEQGIANCRRGNLEQAIIDLTEAIKINPHYAKAYFNRGIAWTLLGQYDIAIHDFERTIAIDPNYPRVHAHKDLAIQKKREGGRPVQLRPTPNP